MFVLESGLFDAPTWGAIAPQSLHLPLQQTKWFPHPSQKSLEQRKEMTFDRRLPNITDLVFQGLCCPSLKIGWKRPCMKSPQIVKN